jgi:hypothetical protein
MGMSSQTFVVRVEEESEPLIETGITVKMLREDEFLEEPRGMGEMPFGRTRVGHGLDHLIIRPKRFNEFQRLPANFTISLKPCRQWQQYDRSIECFQHDYLSMDIYLS